MTDKESSFQNMLMQLQDYWSSQACAILQPCDMPVGAATFHPATFLRAIGPEPWNCAYVQGCRRPADGRYGENPNRMQHYYQFQVVLKPSPDDVQQMYLASLEAIGVELKKNDVRFVEDNWESPTLGAAGLGWEVWLNGMEVSQFTYFQQCGGLECNPVTAEISYGLERLAMHLQQCDDVFDLVWARHGGSVLTYRDVFHQNEAEQSAYNFEAADIAVLTRHFEDSEQAAAALIERGLPMPAYEQVITASHCFNLLDARHAISVTERQRYVLRIRTLAHKVAQLFYETREAAGFPLQRDK